MSISRFSASILSVIVSTTAISATTKGKYFDRAITVIFENTNYVDAMKQPFFKQLSDKGASFSNFLALTHPSQGNYIALTSGALNGVTNDSHFDVNAKNIVDLFEAKGVSWRVYAEDYPGNCFVGMSSKNYFRKHNPFISYLNIQKSPTRCANIVDAAQFDRDAANGTLPSYVFYVPDAKNDGHDTGVAYADKWYRQRFSGLIGNSRVMENTILISTFDESGASLKNQIYTSIVGPAVRPGVYSEQLTIPSLLNLMEDNWDLGNLGKLDTTAAPISDIWQ